MAQRIRVHKYGGSSVADVAKIKRVAQRVAAQRAEGYAMAVVVSAMGDTTDELLALAKEVTPNPSRRELDMLLTAGERISMALLSMALNDIGTPAVSFTGSQSGIITTDDHAQARILEVRPQRVQESLAAGKVVIVAGYQGVSRSREVTTLGRGGSDTTAVALAAALAAEACEIYSDVDGVFTADPRVVPGARKLSELAYEEMQELAACGAKVLNAQAVEFARQSGVAIHAKTTFGEGTGTLVRAAEGAAVVRGIAADVEVALLSAPHAAVEVVRVFLAKRGIAARELERHSELAGWVVSTADVHDDGFAAEVEKLAAGASLRRDVALVSAVGRGAAAAVEALAQAMAEMGATIHGRSRQALSEGVLVDRAHAAEASRAAHRVLVES